MDALARISGVQPGSEGGLEGRTASFSEESSKLDVALDALSRKATDTITLKQEDVTSLQKSEAAHGRKRTDSRGSISGSSHKHRSGAKAGKEQEKDCVLFTCGHHFTRKEFKVRQTLTLPTVLCVGVLPAVFVCGCCELLFFCFLLSDVVFQLCF